MLLLSVIGSLLLLQIAIAADPFNCDIHPTCDQCIASNPCGWCELNIRYTDGTVGPQCAGKPRDPNNPPPGYKPWTCPGPGFQNLYCPSYYCNNATSVCEARRDRNGPTLQQCQSQCFPATYMCNENTGKCEITQPGLGRDLTSCQKLCSKGTFVCDKSKYQCVPSANGTAFEDCEAGCYPPTYLCNRTNLTCYKTVPGQGTDLPSCQRNCTSNPIPAPTYIDSDDYKCSDSSFSCDRVPKGTGVSLADCSRTCNPPQNVTPSQLIGEYRGLMISTGYISGEFTAKITAEYITIKDQSAKVWVHGKVATFGNQLWIMTPKGTLKGIWTEQHLPEVLALTWGLGNAGDTVPPSWSVSMGSRTVFHLGRCLDTNICHWVPFVDAALREPHARRLTRGGAKPKATHKRSEQIIDPCSKYGDCTSCVRALDYCGWCSVPVLYNGTIKGTNCAGLNKTLNPGISCPGDTFTTGECNVPTLPPTKTAPPIPTPPPGPLFVCQPKTQQCVPTNPNNSSGGMPMDFCKLVCQVIPYTPPILVGRVWRGYQINNGYEKGEWKVVFDTNTCVITDSKGVSIKARVGTTSQFLLLDLENGDRIYTLWQLAEAPAIDYFGWAWGEPNQLPPKSYNEAMTKAGQRQFQFMACPCYADSSCFKQPNIPCAFDH